MNNWYRSKIGNESSNIEYNLVEKDLDFVHKICNKWTIDNYQQGDKIVLLLDEYLYEEGYLSICIIHSCLIRNGFFMDIRGWTSSLEDLLTDFDYSNYIEIRFNDIMSFKKFLKYQLNITIWIRW